MSSCHFNYRSLIDHLGSGKDWNLDRKSGGMFILPGSAFGTSHTGARFLLRDLISNKPYLERTDAEYVLLSTSNFVFNSDLTELLDQHLESDADITMMTYTTRYNDRDVVGVELDGDRVVKRTMVFSAETRLLSTALLSSATCLLTCWIGIELLIILIFLRHSTLTITVSRFAPSTLKVM